MKLGTFKNTKSETNLFALGQGLHQLRV